MSLLWKDAVELRAPKDPCLCEHVEHDSPNEAVHPMFMAPDSSHRAAWVGNVCTDCAHGHYAKHVLPDSRCPDCPPAAV